MSLSEVQIDRKALIHNVRALRSLIAKGTAVVAVVKGDAYGHGLAEVVPVLEPEVIGFQVDDIEELRILRRFTSKRALVLGYVAQNDIEEAISLNSELAIYDLERLPMLISAGRKLGAKPKLHLKIDALLGRQGVVPDGLPKMVEALREADGVEVVAAYAHFANIEDTTDLGHAAAQMRVFEDCLNYLARQGFSEIGRHMSATSGLMTVENGNDLVRLGIGMYGMYPSESLAQRHSSLQLDPVMRWVTHLAQVKDLPAGHPVGYGLTYITPEAMRVGIVPQGYSDGYDRGLSSNGEVLVHGERCPVLGRVAMNMFTVDLSRVPDAKVEDEVVLLGKQGKARIAAEELAAKIGTINYEVTARVSSLLARRCV